MTLAFLKHSQRAAEIRDRQERYERRDEIFSDYEQRKCEDGSASPDCGEQRVRRKKMAVPKMTEDAFVWFCCVA